MSSPSAPRLYVITVLLTVHQAVSVVLESLVRAWSNLPSYIERLAAAYETKDGPKDVCDTPLSPSLACVQPDAEQQHSCAQEQHDSINPREDGILQSWTEFSEMASDPQQHISGHGPIHNALFLSSSQFNEQQTEKQQTHAPSQEQNKLHPHSDSVSDKEQPAPGNSIEPTADSSHASQLSHQQQQPISTPPNTTTQEHVEQCDTPAPRTRVRTRPSRPNRRRRRGGRNQPNAAGVKRNGRDGSSSDASESSSGRSSSSMSRGSVSSMSDPEDFKSHVEYGDDQQLRTKVGGQGVEQESVSYACSSYSPSWAHSPLRTPSPTAIAPPPVWSYTPYYAPLPVTSTRQGPALITPKLSLNTTFAPASVSASYPDQYPASAPVGRPYSSSSEGSRFFSSPGGGPLSGSTCANSPWSSTYHTRTTKSALVWSVPSHLSV